jgi:hypothetical protein
MLAYASAPVAVQSTWAVPPLTLETARRHPGHDGRNTTAGTANGHRRVTRGGDGKARPNDTLMPVEWTYSPVP